MMIKKKQYSSMISVLMCTSALTLFVGAASAQDSQPAAATQVQTTVKHATKSNTSLSTDEISKTGSTNTNDALKAMPSLGSFNATGGSGGASATSMFSSPQVHGLAGSLTVILVNGHRFQGAGVFDTTANPGVIPAGAIDHIEVQDDGGNPVYGNDAISGVVNFVLKKDFNGVRVNAKHGFGRGTQNWNVGFLAGTSWDGGSIMVDYEHSSSTALSANKRSYVKSDLSKYYGSDYDMRSTTCSPANVTIGDSSYGLSSDGSFSTTQNKCDNEGLTDLSPSTGSDTGLVSVHQYINHRVEVHADVMYGYQTMKTAIDPTSSLASSGGTSVTVHSNSPYYLSPDGSNADESVTYDPTKDVGAFENYGIMGGLNATMGTQIGLGGSWYNLTDVTFGLEDDSFLLPGINQTYAEEAAEDGSLNPYGIGDANSEDVIHAVKDYGSYYTARQTMTQVVSRFSGDLYNLPGGEVTLQSGVEFRIDKYAATNKTGAMYEDDLLSADSAAVTNVSSINSRSSYALYGTVDIPVVGPANALPLVKKLTLSAAVRYDHYDDVGGSANPHYKIAWDPFDGFEIYSSYAMSFHAPSLTDGANSIDHRASRYADLTGSASAGAYSIVLNGGSDGLKPETARNISVGFRISPDLIPGFTGGLNYFNIKYKNMIKAVGTNGLSNTNAVYNAYRIYNPTLEEAEQWTQGFRHDGTFDFSEKLPTAIYDQTLKNLATEDIIGVDFSGNYALSTGYGNFSVGTSGTWMLSYKRIFNATGSSDEYAGTQTMVSLKMRNHVSWSKDAFDAAVFVNFTNGYTNTNTYTHVDPFITLDTHLGWKLPFKGNFQNMSLSLDVSNILNQDPPHFYSAAVDALELGFDPYNASATGRMVSVGIAKSW